MLNLQCYTEARPWGVFSTPAVSNHRHEATIPMAIPYVPYEGPIVTRAEALAAGLTRFFPGSRCRRNGHLSQRMTSNGGCHACLALHSEAWQKANPEKQRAAIAAWKEVNQEKILADGRKYSAEHRPQIAVHKRAWHARRAAAKLAAHVPDPADYTGPIVTRAEARRSGQTRFYTGKPCKYDHLSERSTASSYCIACNAIILRAWSNTRRSAEGKYTHADILRIGNAQKWRCHWCEKDTKHQYHVDHVIPLAKGGTHWPSNLVISCVPCNRSKNATDPIEFAQRLGRLL
jgi:hypothetical protein